LSIFVFHELNEGSPLHFQKSGGLRNSHDFMARFDYGNIERRYIFDPFADSSLSFVI
jgi:hypothetical protein